MATGIASEDDQTRQRFSAVTLVPAEGARGSKVGLHGFNNQLERGSRRSSRRVSALKELKNPGETVFEGGGPCDPPAQNTTLVSLFLSGRSSKAMPAGDNGAMPADWVSENEGAARNSVATAAGEGGNGDGKGNAEEFVELEYFPDPPCIAPFEDEDEYKPLQKARVGVTPQAYWKGHATWKQGDPQLAMPRSLAASFVEQWDKKFPVQPGSKDANGRLMRRQATLTTRSGELNLVEAFVNISTHSVGIRKINTMMENQKTGEVVAPGQCVIVDKIIEQDGTRFLKLVDGRGWVFDCVGKEQIMAKMEEVETGVSWYRVSCKELVDVRRAPVYDAEAKTGRLLCPKEMAVVNIKCRVRGNHFVHLADGRGWVFTTKPGANKKLRKLADTVMEECDAEIVEGDKFFDCNDLLPATNDIVEVGLWTYVVGYEPVLAIGAKPFGTYISPGDVIKIDKRAYSNGNPPVAGVSSSMWLRLMDGRGWVPEKGPNGKDWVTLRKESAVSYPQHFKGVKNIDKPKAAWMAGVA